MTSRDLFKEAYASFGATLVLIILAALAALGVPIIADFLYAIVALIFIKVAQHMLDRHNLPSEAVGITWERWPRGVVWGLAFTALTLPFFALGYWFWETRVLDRKFEFSAQNYLHWSTELAGEPRGWGADASGVWVWAEKSTLNVGVRNRNDDNNVVFLESDTPFTPQRRGTIRLIPVGASSPQATTWRVEVEDARSRGQVIVRGAENLKVRVEPAAPNARIWPMYQGRNAKPIDTLDEKRSLWWIPLWVATQFLLIALPEEYFYRGWLQTRLEQAFKRRAEERGRTLPSWLGFTPAIVVTSLLFGLGHLLVPIGGMLLPTRMSVFFPALVFGWLRHRTDSIVAPVVYHAFSNLMVLFAAVHFF